MTRSLELELAPGSSALVRETLVLGRAGEVGGRLRNRTTVHRAGREVVVEDTDLDPDLRRRPGLLGDHRVVDSLLAVGVDPGPLPGTATRLTLAEPDSSLTRFLARSLAESPLTQPSLGVPGTA